MRPIQRYKRQRAREQAELDNPEFSAAPADERRGHPRCTSMICVFDMPDGSTLTLQGVWDQVDHLPIDILAQAVGEKASQEHRRRAPK